MEQVMGNDPTSLLSGTQAFCQLNYTCDLERVNGDDPSAFWLGTRCSASLSYTRKMKKKKKVDHQRMRTIVADLPGVFQQLNAIRSRLLSMQEPAFWDRVWERARGFEPL